MNNNQPRDRTDRILRDIRDQHPRLIAIGIAVIALATFVGALKTLGIFDAVQFLFPSSTECIVGGVEGLDKCTLK